MEIRVRLSAGLAPAAGASRLVVTLPDGSTVAGLLEHLCREYPTLEPKMAAAIPMVAGRYTAPADPLDTSQEIALLLPAAGGSG